MKFKKLNNTIRKYERRIKESLEEEVPSYP